MASTQRLRWNGGMAFEGEDAWGHAVAIAGDESEPGAKPSDLLPLSLAACVAYDLVTIIRKQRQDLDALEAEIESTQEDAPPWTFRRIELRFTARGPDERKARRALELSLKECSVLATIAATVEVAATIEVAGA